MIAQPSQVKIRSLPRHLKASIIHCTQFLLTSLLLHAPALEPIYLLFSPSAVLLPRYLHGLLPPPAHALIQRRLLSLPDLNLPDSSSLSYTDSHYLASLFILLHCPLGQFTFYFIISFFFLLSTSSYWDTIFHQGIDFACLIHSLMLSVWNSPC